MYFWGNHGKLCELRKHFLPVQYFYLHFFFSSVVTTVEENETKVSKLMTVFHIFFRFEILGTNRLLQLDPAIDGVFNGPYPIGIDPVNPFLYNLLVTFFSGLDNIIMTFR